MVDLWGGHPATAKAAPDSTAAASVLTAPRVHIRPPHLPGIAFGGA